MNNYFYNSREKEYFSIISKEEDIIDISVIQPKINKHKQIEIDLFMRRCFSVKKMPKNLLLNKNSFTISPQNSQDNKITFLGNKIINYDNINPSEFMISISNRNDKNSYDIISSKEFKNTSDIIDYMKQNDIINQEYLVHLKNFEISDFTLKNKKNNKLKKKIKN